MAMETPESTKKPARREPLNSNVLNYLVWRYLQEVGFAMAATWMGKEWHRSPDEVMPFAKHIKPSQLVHMVQDALLVDEVRGDKGLPTKYFFGDDFGPDYAAPTYDISGERKSGDIPNRRNSEQLGANGAADDLNYGRKRRKHGHAHRKVNGDAMEIDENGYGHSELASDAESLVSAVQEVQPLFNTLSIGESRVVSTEKPVDLLSSSTFLPWPDKCCTSTPIWSPFAKEPLLIGGSNTLRLYGIKSDATFEPLTYDIELSTNNFEVGLMCWTSPSTAAISFFETLEGENTDDEVGKLIHITGYGRESTQVLSSMTGIVRALRFNATSKLLLSLSGGSSTTISIYKVDEPDVSLVCAKDLHRIALSDAYWINETRFIACGRNILQIFEVKDQMIIIIQTQEMKRPWFQLKYDPIADVAIFVNEETTIMRQYHVGTEDTRTHVFSPAKISAFEFQPIPNPDEYEQGTRRLMATCTLDGVVQLWDVTRPFTCVHKLHVYGSPGRALFQISFSSDGKWLAGAGYDLVALWNTAEGGDLKAVWKCSDGERWRSVPEEGAGEDDWIHELKWDMTGEKLVFTLEDQAVVIRAPIPDGA